MPVPFQNRPFPLLSRRDISACLVFSFFGRCRRFHVPEDRARAHPVSPEVLLRLDNDAQVLILAIVLSRQMRFRNASIASCRASSSWPGGTPMIRQLAAESNETNAIRHARGLVVAALQDRYAGLHAGVFEPRLGGALHYRQDAKMTQDPSLQGEAVLHVQPRRTGEEPEISVRLSASATRPARSNNEDRFARSAADRARRRWQSRQSGICPLWPPSPAARKAGCRPPRPVGAAPRPAVRRCCREDCKTAGTVEIEEVPPHDARIVRLVVDFAGRQVQRGQVGRVHGDVAAEQFADQVRGAGA